MDETVTLRERIGQFLGFERVETPVDYDVQESVPFSGYIRHRITYTAADGDVVPAYLLLPEGEGPYPAVIVHHQHASQRHLGKSEVVGIAGDPLQAFAPALAQRGFAVLAPDSVCFEDRRKNATGTQVHEDDHLQHFVEMGNRLVLGDTLMRKVLADASRGLALLAHHPRVDARRIGALGHSYGGNTVLFQAALEPRIAFAAASGALCSYAYKRQHGIPLEMALIIPGFAAHWDLHHLLVATAPRPLLIVSADGDKYSQDAGEVIARARPHEHITHYHTSGGHALTPDRLEQILTFMVAEAARLRDG
ncbi:MAG: acetylxylan esterase [Anaerolineae bacterium]|nr:acetylxylan esterase [Anaerolineae bacterium]